MDSPSSEFVWIIENFSSLNDKEFHYSDYFLAGGCTWSIRIHSKGRTIGKHFSMYLMFKGLDDKSYNTKFSLSIFNQKDHQKTVRQSGQYTFTRNTGSGFSSVLLLPDLHDPAKGFIVEDSCIIQAEITFVKSDAFNVEVPLSTAGKPFEGDNAVVFYDNNFEIVGNFSVLKKPASLYRKIWLKYGHIASTKVFPASSYNSLVTTVADIMNSVIDMYHCRLIEVSAEMIGAWENKIKFAEELQFNVKWLRGRFNDVKRDFNNGRIEKLMKEAEQNPGPSQPPKVKVENEVVDEFKEICLPGFLFEGML
ncbi:MATH domain and coiled-coil domain-containing protein At3g58200-like isoform X1 [Papaver somniferum]|uniref:MATH domain and coiled-coil domain-containing protein At3g58200-like isoform X1 n=2 Tax=Papaver somniferum TaxID=3469 RepID=UPI000E6FA935|nr:MATH domain and coiled-coil domain-containing protein At3g58200-like isoform X1 [Papaver somniferum]XP_026443043.1 MATH domain and coiled-coil domain-containing protein At3g58200-like isoform X1 [Papaver somniferum]XP_026443044.1 MATH domain and coiled-coil domain-containing protein At3g58200-like isoform X1 [Papaver somniferum]XP_026443045.1 MATH domain and coiled-coil domain-containing protein At3g58200-like isoform X1 [Papaver somniferum]